MKETTLSKHTIPELISKLRLKVWELESVVPEFVPYSHPHKFPQERHMARLPEHFHYRFDTYGATYSQFYRKRIEWNVD